MNPPRSQPGVARTKDAPITQEITRASGALCQELDAEANMCILVFSIILHRETQPSDIMHRFIFTFWITCAL